MNYKYRNPILSGFYPDPSICRVGNDFYLVNSTFAYFPGIPVFHSKDLINWKQIGNAIDRPGQLCFEKHNISEGLFAPTIRENNGVFYILCTLINMGGNFIITAKDPRGPWSEPIWLSDADGIDPSIFFDDNGKVWYIGTHPAPEGEAYSGNYEIYIHEIDMEKLASGKNPLIGSSIGLWRGALRGAIWPEGPHIYKIGGWYYLLHAEGGTGLDHAVCIARAKEIKGQWEGKRSNPIVTHRHLGKRAKIINVGHADFVDDTDGNWWMVLLASRQFEGVCPLGRETFIVPIIWENEWPYIATDSGLIEEGLPQEIAIENDNCDPLDSCDYFNGNSLPFHWLTLRMPVDIENTAFSLTERKDALRLFTTAATMRGKDHPAFAGRRIRHKNWSFHVLMEFYPKKESEAAGLILLQSENYQYRLEKYLAPNCTFMIRLIKAAGKEDEIITSAECPKDETPLMLAAVNKDMKFSFFYGKDNNSLKCLKDNMDARLLSTEYAGGFVGTLAGVFATGCGENTGNHADVIFADYRGLA
ncbi:glycoside hydrolase family 43 protein [Treponema sp. R80B11-R83G3]